MQYLQIHQHILHNSIVLVLVLGTGEIFEPTLNNGCTVKLKDEINIQQNSKGSKHKAITNDFTKSNQHIIRIIVSKIQQKSNTDELHYVGKLVKNDSVHSTNLIE